MVPKTDSDPPAHWREGNRSIAGAGEVVSQNRKWTSRHTMGR